MGEPRRCKREIMQREKCSIAMMCVCIFAFLSRFFPEIAAKWKLRTPFAFFPLSHVGAVCAVQQFALAIMFLRQREVFFGGREAKGEELENFSAETRGNFNWKLPEILFAFAVLTV